MERAWYEQEELNKYLKQKWNGNKSKEQKKMLININILFNRNNDTIKFVSDYGQWFLNLKEKQPKQKDSKY